MTKFTAIIMVTILVQVLVINHVLVALMVYQVFAIMLTFLSTALISAQCLK